jgi:hypothetical protein
VVEGLYRCAPLYIPYLAIADGGDCICAAEAVFVDNVDIAPLLVRFESRSPLQALCLQINKSVMAGGSNQTSRWEIARCWNIRFSAKPSLLSL